MRLSIVLLAAFTVYLSTASGRDDEKSKAFTRAIHEHLSRYGQVRWPRDRFTLYAREVKDGRLGRTTFMLRNEAGKTTGVLLALSGELKADVGRKQVFLTLHEGHSFSHESGDAPFKTKQFTLPLPDLKSQQ